MSLQLGSSSGGEHPIPSELHRIISKAQNQIRRIDEFERKLDERVRMLRRRACNVIDTTLPYRSSHLRCFLTHACHDVPPDPNASTDYTYVVPKSLWVLRLEGKLLIEHLDHASAKERDAETNYKAPNDDLDRTKGEAEEEEVVPIQFTHFFESIEVELITTFAPRPHPMAKKKVAAPATKKRRGNNSKAQSVDDENSVDPKTLVVSNKFSMYWSKQQSKDAHAFDFHYKVPPPPEPRYQVHYVTAKLKLYLNQSASEKDPLFAIASVPMAREFFPRHVASSDETKTADGTNNETEESKKRKGTGDDDGTSHLPPSEDDIHIPEGLTMRQIVFTFFQYIHDHNLCDENDRATIKCDEKLKGLFGGLEQFAFSELQQILITRNLIRPLYQHHPVVLTYVMREAHSTNYEIPADKTSALSEDALPSPSQLQLDMNVAVPTLFPYRARELLRRIKRRELEYTSSRTKARYLLMSQKAKDEEDVRAILDDAVSGHVYGDDYIPVFHALAKAAPPHTEARSAAQLDARLAYLLPRVQEHVASAKEAWKRVGSHLSLQEKQTQPPNGDPDAVTVDE